MRLQVFLSHSGACSRRKALEYIKQGKVTVNDRKIFEPSHSVHEQSDIVLLDGKCISIPQKVYILLNKPKGVVTTVSDRFAEKKVLDLLPKNFKNLYPVGRLDKDTSGLLLLTNDGALTHRLIHPSFEVEKAYRVLLNKPISGDDKNRLQKGIVLDGKKTAPCQIKKISQNEFEIIIHEGRKRQIRRMFASLHYHVVALVRIRQGSLTLGNLKVGEWRFLTKEEVDRLYNELKIK